MYSHIHTLLQILAFSLHPLLPAAFFFTAFKTHLHPRATSHTPELPVPRFRLLSSPLHADLMCLSCSFPHPILSGCASCCCSNQSAFLLHLCSAGKRLVPPSLFVLLVKYAKEILCVFSMELYSFSMAIKLKQKRNQKWHFLFRLNYVSIRENKTKIMELPK